MKKVILLCSFGLLGSFAMANSEIDTPQKTELKYVYSQSDTGEDILKCYRQGQTYWYEVPCPPVGQHHSVF